MIESMGAIESNLEQGAEEIWFSNRKSKISYPKLGNDICFALEEDSFWFKHRNKCIVQAIRQFPPTGPIYEVGAGNGFVSSAIKEAGFQPVVIEPGIVGCRNAHMRGLSPVICSNLEGAGFPSESLPAIAIFDVLEHIKDEINFIQTIRRHLIPGGILYLTVPAYQFLWSGSDEKAGHFRRYKINTLTALFEKYRFDVLYQTYFFSFLLFPIYLFRTIPYLIGKKKRALSRRKAIKQHKSREKLNWLLNLVSSVDLNAIKNRKSLRFGSSCLSIYKVPLS